MADGPIFNPIEVPQSECPIGDCKFAYPQNSAGITLMNAHIAALHPGMVGPNVAPPASARTCPRITRPIIDSDCTPAAWATFMCEWEDYSSEYALPDSSKVTQFMCCLSLDLKQRVHSRMANYRREQFDNLVARVKSLAIKPVAIGKRRREAHMATQKQGELFTAFATRVRGLVIDCEYTLNCPHAVADPDSWRNGKVRTCNINGCAGVNFEDAVVRDILLAGIYDEEVRRLVLAENNVHHMPVSEVIDLVQRRESAREDAMFQSVPEAAAISQHGRNQKGGGQNKGPQPSKNGGNRPKIRPKEKLCECGNKYFDFARMRSGGFNKNAYTRCRDCAVKERREKLRARRNISLNENCDSASNDEDKAVASAFRIAASGNRSHPRLPITVTMPSRSGPFDIKVMGAVADSGAQVSIFPSKMLQGNTPITFAPSPSKTDIRGADGSPLVVTGAVDSTVAATNQSGEIISTEVKFYMVENVSECYLSWDAMRGLRIVNEHFPEAGSGDRHDCSLCTLSADVQACTCTPRTRPPPAPEKLPFAPSPHRIPDMKKWLLERYASSTFNKCTHQVLPEMDGPPLEIHLQENASPRHVSTPATIPLHWQERVKRDLDNDVKMGVIEPVTEPSEWCQRMVCVRKHDGTPRRTVDLQPLNKFCKREPWVANTPSKQARSVPKGAWKTVTDAWNGYHSVPLRESDRHLTTFITPWGRYRYRRNPQGFVGAGDGYNRRFDAVLTDFTNKERCVDDTIFWDTDLEKHWWRTIEFLDKVGNAGMVLNPDKFQFCQNEAEFAGFLISDSKVSPLRKYLDAIAEFPRPKNICDVRSWFGLINQVSNYGKLREFMEPFRPFLSPKRPFEWSPDLDEAFVNSRREIVEAIKEGVEIFDPSLATCLRTDWSTKGMGYYLVQKTCECQPIHPDCCTEGWRITLAGSRFNTPTEARYAPIEGEALAIAWALRQTKFFTMGCDKLLIATDHKPLIRLLKDKTLDNVDNPRLFRLKQKVAMWNFDIIHCAGVSNIFADATSRRPLDAEKEDITEEAELIACAISAISINLEEIQSASKKDPQYLGMIQALAKGSAAPEACGDYWLYRHKMYSRENVLLYDDRVVIPVHLRDRILDVLHGSHQGTTSMHHRASSTVFWPGISQDIRAKRDSCKTCNSIAPSLPQIPMEQSEPASLPFQKIAADYFDLNGCHYLVTVDRLSGWIDINGAKPSTPASGAKGLIACLRLLFQDKGIPEELSSDGGTEFTSSETQDFLRTWGVRHRLSSAHHPQSNGKAESAVKIAKRLLRNHTLRNGSLDTNAFMIAIMGHRNTPDPLSGLSPAQVIYGRNLPDAFRFTNEIFKDKKVRETWRTAWRLKEKANRHRFFCQQQTTNARSKAAAPLPVGTRVFVQERQNNKSWNRSGIVVENKGFGQYRIKLDGSGRLSLRTRAHLKPFHSYPQLGTAGTSAPLLLDPSYTLRNAQQDEGDNVQSAPTTPIRSQSPTFSLGGDSPPSELSPSSPEPMEMEPDQPEEPVPQSRSESPQGSPRRSQRLRTPVDKYTAKRRP